MTLMQQKERGEDAVPSSFYRRDDSGIDKHLCHGSCRQFDDASASPLSWVSQGCILIGTHGYCSAAIQRQRRAGAQSASAGAISCKQVRFAPYVGAMQPHGWSLSRREVQRANGLNGKSSANCNRRKCSGS